MNIKKISAIGGSAYGGKMKNKIIIFFSCLGIMFFVVNFCLADSESDTYYENKQAESQAAGAEAEVDAFNKQQAEISKASESTDSEKERDAYNQAQTTGGAGAPCGSNNEGTCMTGSFSCPDGASHLWGGSDCGSGFRCCKADSSSSGSGSGSGSSTYNSGDPVSGLNTGTGTQTTTATGSGIYIPESTGLPNNTVQGVLKNLLTWLLGTMGILAMIGFIVSGIMYIMSSGNDEMITKAKSGFKYSVIGITVALSSFIIIQAIQYALQGTSWF